MNDIRVPPYENEQSFITRLGHEEVQVISKPGLPEWDQITPSTILLANSISIDPGEKVLFINSHQGALGVFLARQLSKGNLTIYDQNILALQMTGKTLQANKINNVNIRTDIELSESDYLQYDSVIIQIPKGRTLVRRWLMQAKLALREKGNLWISGSNKSGVQSIVKDTEELFGNIRILGYKKGNRVAQSVNIPTLSTLPDWADIPGISPHTWVEFSINISSLNLNIRSLPGVFSYDHLDAGTELLINSLPEVQGKRVLDVGCGYGIIGCYAALHGAIQVDLVDNNLLAIASSRETLSNNHVTNASVYAGDLLEPVFGKRYDLILSNPPFHAGLQVDHQIAEAMIRQAHRALDKMGKLVIVANRFIRYDHLIKEIFGNVSCLAETGKFFVLSALK